MKPRTLQEIAQMCKGRVEFGDPLTLVSGVSTDSRTLSPGDLFVALRGERHDGHDFVAAACEAGAAAVMVSRPVQVSCPVVRVQDTLLALGSLGASARDDSVAQFLAVTGSAGKTTTKDMLGAVVSLAGVAAVAPGTENNEVGVPRLLVRLTPEVQFCVLELAMRGPGEIAYLARMCRPHIGVITNIGEAHVGRLGSREAIAAAKAELLAALPPTGTAVLNADDFFFGLLRELAPCPVVSFGFCEWDSTQWPPEVTGHVWAQDVHAEGLAPARFRLHVGDEALPVQLQLPGRHNVANALAAAAAAHAAGVPPALIRAGLESYGGQRMRSEVLRAPRGFTIINDAYNASPTSVAEALQMLGRCPGRRVFVFGDMLELGPAAGRAHRDVGRLAVRVGVDWLIAIGPNAALAAEEADAAGIQTNVVADVSEAVGLLSGALEAEDTVLVKASRAMGLEAVVQGLLQATGDSGDA